jgi:hypothetical protein
VIIVFVEILKLVSTNSLLYSWQEVHKDWKVIVIIPQQKAPWSAWIQVCLAITMFLCYAITRTGIKFYHSFIGWRFEKLWSKAFRLPNYSENSNEDCNPKLFTIHGKPMYRFPYQNFLMVSKTENGAVCVYPSSPPFPTEGKVVLFPIDSVRSSSTLYFWDNQTNLKIRGHRVCIYGYINSTKKIYLVLHLWKKVVPPSQIVDILSQQRSPSDFSAHNFTRYIGVNEKDSHDNTCTRLVPNLQELTLKGTCVRTGDVRHDFHLRLVFERRRFTLWS